MPLLSAPPGAAYGWRARIALMQPSGVAENNPYEFYLMAPPGVVLERLAFTNLGVTYRAAKEVFKKACNADGIWITGALMPSVGVIQALEDDLGVPVVTSMQAMAWAGLRAAGIPDKITGFGRLFQVA